MPAAEEQFDVLDCRGNRTGKRIGRDEAHASGAWHGAFHCLIVYLRDTRLQALFQLRSHEKKIAANRFDVSVGGHYAAGEDAAAAGPREISEELGLRVPFGALVPLGRRVSVYCFEPPVRECEFQDVFLLPLAAPPDGLVLQRSEVEAVLELAVEEGIRLFSGDLPALAGRLLRSSGVQETATIREADFVPSVDRYHLKLLQLAKRYAAGERSGLAL